MEKSNMQKIEEILQEAAFECEYGLNYPIDARAEVVKAICRRERRRKDPKIKFEYCMRKLGIEAQRKP